MAGDPGPVARALLRVTDDGCDGRELARHLCRACVEGTSVDGAAVSVLTVSVHRETLFATDATAATLEDLQFTLGEGICIEAAVSGRPVLVSDLDDHVLTTRWPVFATAVADQTDTCALFALPLQLGTINVGVVDLYRARPGPLGGAELRDVLAAVDAATLMMLGAQLRADLEHPAEDGGGSRWDGSAAGRAEVHQATGMLLAQLDLPAQDAFVRLRAYAFAHRRPLDEVARDVVARRLVFTEDMD